MHVVRAVSSVEQERFDIDTEVLCAVVFVRQRPAGSCPLQHLGVPLTPSFYNAMSQM